MLRACPWNGQPCGDCETWPHPVDGRCPPKCEARTPFEMSVLYLSQMSPERQAAYKKWVADGYPLRTTPKSPDSALEATA